MEKKINGIYTIESERLHCDGSRPSITEAQSYPAVSEVRKYQRTGKDWPCFTPTLPTAPVQQRSAICGQGKKQIRHQLPCH